MESIIRQDAEEPRSGDDAVDRWKATLGLVAKLMSRPTFYPGMRFQDLVEIADRVGEVMVKHPSERTDGLSELYFAAAQNTIQYVRSLAQVQGSRPMVC